MNRYWPVQLLFGLTILMTVQAVRGQESGNDSRVDKGTTGTSGASGGTPAGVQAVGPAALSPDSVYLRGDLVGPPQLEAGADNPRVQQKPVSRPNRSSFFNRVTTAGQQAAGSASRAARGARQGGSQAGMIRSQADPLRPYTSRSPNVTSSTNVARSPRPPEEDLPAVYRSAPHTYYPGLRANQHPNANTVQPSRTGKGRTIMPFGMSGLSTGAKSARSGQATLPVPRGSSPASAPRR
jgi:hypothetical protein